MNPLMGEMFVSLWKCEVNDGWSTTFEDWGIFKSRVDDADAYYLYDKRNLRNICYFVSDEPFANISKYSAIDNNKAYGISKIRYDRHKGTYEFSISLKDDKGSRLTANVEYNTNTDILSVKYNPDSVVEHSFIRTFKNSVPRLDNHSKIKLTLSGVCAFTELDTKVVEEVD